MSDGPNSPEWLGQEINRHAEQIETLAKALPASEPQAKILGRCEDIRHYAEEATKAPALTIPHHPTGVCACPSCWPRAQGC
jgi:aspartate/methionine/tyrosine aminotransferase